ncbi:MAG: PQQ-binding-like beta-propeller repeat protein, partial [Acidimicrobiales bacterium]|nr:PQQ-binding-like beta-propeller repeat protein [Acidimicrobiales bacterium]
MADPSACDSCGAMLPLPDAEGHVTCLSCGRRASVSTAGDAETGSPRIAIANTTATVDLKQARGCAKGGIVGALLLFFGIPILVVGILIAAGVFSGNLSNSNRSGSSGNLIVLEVLDAAPATDGKTAVLALVQETTGGSYRRFVSRIELDDRGAEEMWRSPSLGKDISNVRAVPLDHGVAVVSEDRLLLLDDRGKSAWETKLSDVVSGGCTACLAWVGSTLIVQTSDGGLQAYALRSPERRWSRTLASPASRFAVAGDHVVLIDDPADQDPFVEVVDPATGKSSGRSATPCTDRHGSSGARLSPIPDSDQVLLIVGYSQPCAAIYDAAKGTIGPEFVLPDDLYLDSTTKWRPVVVGNEVTLPARDSVALLDVTTGRTRTLPLPEGVNATPSQVVDGTLLATTAATRGTPVGGIAAWKVSSGELAWSTEFTDRVQLLDLDSTFGGTVFTDDARAALARDAHRPTVVTFRAGDDPAVSVAPVDLASG